MSPVKVFITFVFISVWGVASSLGMSPEARHYEKQFQIFSTADVRVSERTTFAELPPQFEEELPLALNDQMGNSWKLAYSNLHASIDGRPVRYETFSNKRDLLLHLDMEDEVFAPGEHTITIEYVTSNAVRRDGDWERLQKTLGGDFKIDALDAYIVLPPGVSSDAVGIDASTDFTPTSSSCACRIERNGEQLSIHVTRPLQLGEELSFTLSFSSGFLKRPFTQRVELFEQNNPGKIAWAKFLTSLVGYYSLAFVALRFLGATRESALATYTMNALFVSSVAMAAVSLVVLAIAQQPEVAMPGVFGGILSSMAFGGSPHGPSSRYLWIPFAFVINALFYYLLWRLFQGIARIWSKPKPVIRRENAV